MGMTIAEKIIARAAGVSEVRPGDIHTVEVDRLMSNDGTTHLTIDMYHNKLKHPHIADVNKLVWIVDHNVPSDSPKTAASQKKMRDFAKEHGIKFYEGQGVCHQIMMENHVCPGELIFGADSHTCAYGALGAFGTGVGCTDYLYAMVTGKSWVLVPETLRFNLTGKLPEGVYARDLILTIIGKIGANGANYKAMEFAGDGMKNLTMSDRIAICNLCVEAGAKTALMEVDDIALHYLHEHGREPKACFASDADAHFAAVYDIDLSTITPIVAKPHFVDNVCPAKEAAGVKIDEAFRGSCNNGRIEDLRKYQVTVATSDGLEQIIIRGQGCAMMSARELKEEINRINQEIRRDYVEQFPGSKNYLFDYLPEDLQKHLQDVRMGNAEFGSHQKKQEE